MQRGFLLFRINCITSQRNESIFVVLLHDWIMPLLDIGTHQLPEICFKQRCKIQVNGTLTEKLIILVSGNQTSSLHTTSLTLKLFFHLQIKQNNDFLLNLFTYGNRDKVAGYKYNAM